jgi:hypothetical protein
MVLLDIGFCLAALDKQNFRLLRYLIPCKRRDKLYMIVTLILLKAVFHRIDSRETKNAGDGSRTREHLRDRVLSPAPLTTWQPPRISMSRAIIRASPHLEDRAVLELCDP